MTDYPKSLVEFQRMFPDDAACAEHLAKTRWPEGFVCPGCGGGEAWRIPSRNPLTFACKACRKETSVTAGTVMHGSHLPLSTWFWAAFLMATHSNGISALQLQKQLGIGAYETAWLLARKLREAMVDPARSPLSGLVEADEASLPFHTKDDPPAGGRGRSHQGKMLLVVAAEVVRAPNEELALGRIRIAPIADYSQKSLHAFLGRNVADGTKLRTDAWPSYRHAPGVEHDPHTVRSMAAHVLLPAVHRVISNLKTWALGVYHGLRPRYLRAYLEEFVFRFNRRHNRHAGFATLLGLSASHAPVTYKMLKIGLKPISTFMYCRHLILVLSIAIVHACGPASQEQDRDVTVEGGGASVTNAPPLLGTSLCDTDRASVSPTGEYLLFTPDPSIPPRFATYGGGVFVYAVDCLVTMEDWKSCSSRDFRRRIGTRIRSAGWLGGGEVFIWDSRGGHIAASVKTPEIPLSGPSVDYNADARIYLQGAPDQDEVVGAIAQSMAVEYPGTLSAVVVQPDRPFLLVGVRPANGGFVEYALSSEVRFQTSDIHETYAVRFVIGNGTFAPPGAYLNGDIAIVTPLEPSAVTGMEAFSTPVVDSLTGEVIGVVAPPNRLELPGQKELENVLSQLITDDTSDGGRTVLRAMDIHVDAEIAVISYVRDLNARTFRVVRWENGMETNLVSCGASEAMPLPFSSYDSRLEDVRSRFLTRGSPQWPIAGILLQHGESKRRLVVFLSGGPGGTTLRDEPVRWRRYLEAGFDLLAVAVSGGADLGSAGLERLSADPVTAFERDAALLAALLDDELAAYDDIVIHAASLSGGLALELAERLGSRSVRVVLVSPWLGYEPPRSWAPDPRYQQRYEAVALGFTSRERRERYFAWIDALTRRAQASRVLIVAGEDDDRIDLAALERLRTEGRAQVVILDQLGHATVTVAQPAWEKISEFIAVP